MYDLVVQNSSNVPRWLYLFTLLSPLAAYWAILSTKVVGSGLVAISSRFFLSPLQLLYCIAAVQICIAVGRENSLNDQVIAPRGHSVSDIKALLDREDDSARMVSHRTAL